jgi:hypothetical protein
MSENVAVRGRRSISQRQVDDDQLVFHKNSVAFSIEDCDKRGKVSVDPQEA